MATPDVSELSLSDLQQLIGAANAAVRDIQAAKAAEIEAHRADIAASVDTLTGLLGSEDEPGTILGNAEDHVYECLRVLSETVRSLAVVVAGKDGA